MKMTPVNDLAPGIGHNLPPLQEQLVDETVEIEKRAADLVGSADRAIVTDRTTAEKATLLVGMMRDHLKVINEAREARKRPFLESGRTVDAHFNGIAGRLATFDAKGKVVGGPMGIVADKVDKFRREEEARAEAERRRLAEEARIEREKAEAAARAQREAEERAASAAREAEERIRRAEEEARRAGDRAAAEAAARARAEQEKVEADARRRRMEAELEARRSADAAAALERRAEAAVAAPIDSGVGVKASARKTTVVMIDDLGKAARHCLKVAEPEMREVIQKVYDRLARAKVRDLPGATVREDSSTVFRTA